MAELRVTLEVQSKVPSGRDAAATTRLARSRALAISGLLVAIFGASACRSIPNEPVRVERDGIAREVATSIDALRDTHEQQRVRTASVERHPGFILTFVELDDQGWLWSRAQLFETLETIRNEAVDDGALILVFTHGWKHNAEVCDENVTCFRRLLEAASRRELAIATASGRRPRHVVGVYVGWRGLTYSGQISRQFTFWSRKTVAERIGHTDGVEVFGALQMVYGEINHPQRRSTLVVIGHSFGAAVVFAGTSDSIKSSVLTSTYAVGRTPHMDPILRVMPQFTDRIGGYGDFVILINPAFEAARYHTIDGFRYEMRVYDADQRPIIATFSSVTDLATRRWFPIGRRFALLGDSLRDSEQTDASLETLGNFAPYRTHMLAPCGVNTAAPAAAASHSACDCPNAISELGATLVSPVYGDRVCYGTAELEPVSNTPRRMPFIVAQTSDELISGHNGIFTSAFMTFLLDYVNAITVAPDGVTLP